ncbi:glycosyltransferase family 61 protein [Pimelobacter simplex]|uniref:Glycosyltransferase family 61 protein n=1 Tax=Nocardioides simplex TaxID=2045 RepID=A0A7J5DST7_NOCSI|nr:glycosyltransferase 61 family protein [Pimelobacter simplex]KAB2808209.1 glycosyltransferase family 61 protein [Pimelobacter simplex]
MALFGGKRRSRSPSSLVALLAPAASGPGPSGLVLGDPVLAAELRAALPGLTLLDPPADPPARHRALTAAGPLDLVVDDPDPDDRLRRFNRTFFHLRPGGPYVIPGGATELGPDAGPLGRLLQEAAALPDEPLRERSTSLDVCRLRALRSHVRAEAVDGHLVLSHDLPDVHVLIREEHFDDHLAAAATPHRVLAVHPASAPPDEPDAVELPQPRVQHAERPIEPAPLHLRDYRDVVVSPYQVVLGDRLVLPDSFRHFPQPNLHNKMLAKVAPMFAVPVTPVPAEVPYLRGTFLHLDNEARGHFGHLLTESLSRVWAWPEALALDPDARVVVCATVKRPRLLEYELAVYEAAGIPRDHVVLVDGPTRVERLISGTPLFSNPYYVDPRIAATWDAVGDQLAATAPPRAWPRRIFLSRRETKRACVNGPELEQVFVEHGFEIVFPEDYPLGEQVAMFRAAEVIAGFAGSGMFQIAFVREPTTVIQVGSEAYGPRNEYLMAAVRRHRLTGIVCQAYGGRGLAADWRYDEQREGPALRAVLGGL